MTNSILFPCIIRTKINFIFSKHPPALAVYIVRVIYNRLSSLQPHDLVQRLDIPIQKGKRLLEWKTKVRMMSKQNKPSETEPRANLDWISRWLDSPLLIRAVWTPAAMNLWSSLILRRDSSSEDSIRLFLLSAPHWLHVPIYQPLPISLCRSFECRKLSHLQFVWLNVSVNFHYRLTIVCTCPMRFMERIELILVMDNWTI